MFNLIYICISIIYRELIFFFKYVEFRLFNFNVVIVYIVIILYVMGELLFKKKINMRIFV